MGAGFDRRRMLVLLAAVALVAVNAAIVWPLFGVEYSAHTGSIEGTFIAIGRIMAEHPGEWDWWPYWNGGLPFEHAYLPMLHWLAAGFQLATGYSPARSYHIVTAGIYSLSALPVFFMLLAFSRKLAASFTAALAYSCFSLSALLVPAVRADVGGAWNLRRLQDFVFWVEPPHALALALTPIAILAFARALSSGGAGWKIAAGFLAGCVALSNVFGVVALGMGLLAWLLSYPSRPWWRAWGVTALTAALSYCWVSPWLSPSLIRAMQENAPLAGGDFRYTAASWIALAVLAGGYAVLWAALRRTRLAPYLQFLALFAYLPTGLVPLWHFLGVAVVPQASRYEQEMDLALMALAVLGGAAVLERVPKAARVAVCAIVFGALAIQVVHCIRYGREIIRSVDVATLSEFKIAKWLDANRPGERSFVAGSTSMLFNVFTDNPQLMGGHHQQIANSFVPVVAFTIRVDENAGERAADYSNFWMRAFGVRTVVVSEPPSTERYEAYVNPKKFEGVLPVLWRDGGDTIYEVPSRSRSLAHVIPASAVVERRPIHGLDIEPVEAFVAALEDPQYPVADFEWKGMNEAVIRASVNAGQVVAVQMTYTPGWEAWANGERLPVRGDAIGQMIVEPDCSGPCEIALRYTGGIERTVTRALSILAMLAAVGFAWFEDGRSA